MAVGCGAAGAGIDCELDAGMVTVKNVVKDDVGGGEEGIKTMEEAVVGTAVSFEESSGVEVVAAGAGVNGSSDGHGTADPPMYVCPFRTTPPKVIPAEETHTGPFG